MATKRSNNSGKSRQPSAMESNPFASDLAAAFGGSDGPVCLDSADDALIGRFVKLVLNAHGYCGFGSRADTDHISLSLRFGEFGKSLTIIDTKQFEGVVSTVHKALRKGA